MPSHVDDMLETLDVDFVLPKRRRQRYQGVDIMKLEPAEILNASILIVDDRRSNIDLLEQLLREDGYLNVASTTNSREVCGLHLKNSYDLILLDLQMPDMDGFQLMEALRTQAADSYLPVIVITAQPGHKVRALQCGAKDFVSKPFDLIEVRTRIHNMLEVRLLYKKLTNYNEVLEQTVQQRTAELLASEERYRCLTELACDWYWEQDETGKFTEAAGPVLELLGSSVNDAAAKQGDSGDRWDERARVELKSRIAARQPFLDFVLARVNSDGTQQRYQISGQPVFDCSCGYVGYRGVGVELTTVPSSVRNVLSS